MKMVFEHLGIILNGKYISSFDMTDSEVECRIVLWMSNGVKYIFSGDSSNISSLSTSLIKSMEDTNEVIFNRTIKSCWYGSMK